ncbi:AraC family transcriptional regulator [Lacibacterium aquatile]|uniref:AraC family transcriptional regulator n=1 Tax=Lacibacterium aquatile TaxID=1168082 RepID=A0ABW5DKK5_9PROT
MSHDDLDFSGEQARFFRVPEGDTEILEARFRRHVFTPHVHDRYVFGIVTKGVEGFSYRGETHYCDQGSIAILEPDELHDGFAAVEDGWAYRMAYLEPELLEQAAKAAYGERWSGLPGFAGTIIRDPDLFSGAVALFDALGEADRLARESELLSVLTALVGRHSHSHPRPSLIRADNQRLSQVRDRLLSTPEVTFSLDDLASTADLSPYHLLRAFRAAYGQTPHAFQTQARLRMAEAALRSGETIAEVAAASGFADQAHLTRTFKRYRGVTPGAFRKAGRAA